MPTYATTHDIAHLNLDPQLAQRLINHTARLIRHHTRTSIYTTNPDGTPTNPTIQNAFTQATIAHITALAENNLTTTALTGSTQNTIITSSSTNGSSVTFDNSTAAHTQQHFTDGGLSTEAATILDDACPPDLPRISYQ